MKSFEERNPVVIGLLGAALLVVLVGAALQYDKLPFMDSDRVYGAFFADAGGLQPGDAVQYSGLRVGQVSSVKLDGSRVLVKFGVNKNVRLGDRTEAAIKARALLGDKILELVSRGSDTLTTDIPIERTTSPYQLPDALGDLSATISGLDTQQLSASLATLAETFKATPPELRKAVDGVARFAQSLNTRDEQLRNLLRNANKVTSVLAERSDAVVRLVADANALLVQLQSQSASLDHISSSVSALSRQLSGFIADNRHDFKSALDKLNGVLTIVDNRKERVQQAIKYLNAYAMSLGESVASGPFFKAYVANLLPGQFLQPFINAAFSDLGIDPNTLLPSERTDPQIGQPGTPALPLPYPRTGQGGQPNLTLPEAITGNPGDPGCGPPGVPLPGPTGCYPYREPLPAPAPGGPPPGPPAPAPASQVSVPDPTPSPVYVPAPNEPSPQGGQP